MKNNINFYTLFTKTENVHLLKDVGMVPESLSKKYKNINSYLVTYENGDYSYMGTMIKNTKLLFIKKNFGKYIDGMNFIKKNAKDIDILNIYHLNLSSFWYCIVAKFFLRKDSIIYLKLDVDSDEIRKLRKWGIRALIKRLTIKMADVVTGETSILVKQLQKIDSKIKFIPNGGSVCDFEMDNSIPKLNRFITVGRLGNYLKNTELVVDAFIKTYKKHDWELHLIGSYTKEFKDYIEEKYIIDSSLKKRIFLKGEIIDKEVLYKEYEKAKVFLLPSRRESFGLVLIEALSSGEYIMTSDHVPSAYDIIPNSSIGEIIKEDSIEAWSEAMLRITRKTIDWKTLHIQGIQHTKNNFNWDGIAEKIYKLCIEKIEDKSILLQE